MMNHVRELANFI